MKLNLKEDRRTLTDNYGEALTYTIPSGAYGVLVNVLGYTAYNMDYIDVTITKDVLNEHFEPAEDFSSATYISSKRKLFNYNPIFKMKDQDSYLLIGLDLTREAAWDEATDESIYKEDYFKVHKMFYKVNTPNMEDIVEFYNSHLTFKTNENKASINIVLKTMSGFIFKDYEVKPLEIDLKKHYNDDFYPKHEQLLKDLKEGGKGIVMLHGSSGSGKTNYLKYLTKEVSNKKFVFVPSTMIGYLTDPSFISNLIDNKNSILVLEDCEVYIKDRKNNTGNNDFVGSLLNLSDGFLSDIMSLQVICTFNNDLGDIDQALLREGRLLCQYEFGPLDENKAQALAEELGVELLEKDSRTLAGIYNKSKGNRKVEKKTTKIGFR